MSLWLSERIEAIVTAIPFKGGIPSAASGGGGDLPPIIIPEENRPNVYDTINFNAELDKNPPVILPEDNFIQLYDTIEFNTNYIHYFGRADPNDVVVNDVIWFNAKSQIKLDEDVIDSIWFNAKQQVKRDEDVLDTVLFNAKQQNFVQDVSDDSKPHDILWFNAKAQPTVIDISDDSKPHDTIIFNAIGTALGGNDDHPNNVTIYDSIWFNTKYQRLHQDISDINKPYDSVNFNDCLVADKDVLPPENLVKMFDIIEFNARYQKDYIDITDDSNPFDSVLFNANHNQDYRPGDALTDSEIEIFDEVWFNARMQQKVEFLPGGQENDVNIWDWIFFNEVMEHDGGNDSGGGDEENEIEVYDTIEFNANFDKSYRPGDIETDSEIEIYDTVEFNEAVTNEQEYPSIEDGYYVINFGTRGSTAKYEDELSCPVFAGEPEDLASWKVGHWLSTMTDPDPTVHTAYRGEQTLSKDTKIRVYFCVSAMTVSANITAALTQQINFRRGLESCAVGMGGENNYDIYSFTFDYDDLVEAVGDPGDNPYFFVALEFWWTPDRWSVCPGEYLDHYIAAPEIGYSFGWGAVGLDNGYVFSAGYSGVCGRSRRAILCFYEYEDPLGETFTGVSMHYGVMPGYTNMKNIHCNIRLTKICTGWFNTCNQNWDMPAGFTGFVADYVNPDVKDFVGITQIIVQSGDWFASEFDPGGSFPSKRFFTWNGDPTPTYVFDPPQQYIYGEDFKGRLYLGVTIRSYKKEDYPGLTNFKLCEIPEPEPRTKWVTISKEGEGEVSPLGEQWVFKYDYLDIEIEPAKCWKIDEILVDGVSVPFVVEK